MWPTQLWADTTARLAIVLITVWLAALVTKLMGDQRTIKFTPYPASYTDDEKVRIRSRYSCAQFGATAGIFFSDPTLSWSGLSGIQSAPFLMTLIRKGKISSHWFHRWYAFSLFIAYLAFMNNWRHAGENGPLMLFSILGVQAVQTLRFNYRIDTSLLWTAFAG